MKFLVLMGSAPGVDLTQMLPVLPAEAKHAWEMYKSGIARELHLRGDGKGAVLVLECVDLAEAERQIGGLPLMKAGLARVEIIPLAPFTPFENLFARPAS
jgi:hypothetical protein